MYHFPFFKKVSRHGVPHLTIRNATKFPQIPEQFLLPGSTKMPHLRLGEFPVLDLGKSKLYRIVPMTVLGLHGGHETRPHLNHRHGMQATMFVVDLRHAQLFSY